MSLSKIETAMLLTLVILAGPPALAQQLTAAQRAAAAAAENAPRPPLQFREVWQQPPYSGQLTDAKRRVSQVAVSNPNLQLLTYGTDAQNITVYSHESRHDLWTGLATSPVAILLRDRNSYFDLRGLARLRGMIRTNGLQELHPVVRLADGTLLVGSQVFSTNGQFLEAEIAYGEQLNPEWFQLDSTKVVVGHPVMHPDLSRVDAVGFVDLIPGGGHGVAASSNVSEVELYAVAVPR
jgi:hypothetical protein